MALYNAEVGGSLSTDSGDLAEHRVLTSQGRLFQTYGMAFAFPFRYKKTTPVGSKKTP